MERIKSAMVALLSLAAVTGFAAAGLPGDAFAQAVDEQNAGGVTTSAWSWGDDSPPEDPIGRLLSPVVGAHEAVGRLSACSGTRWCFNQHGRGYHQPDQGLADADDTYAWDINLNYPRHDSDAGRPVYPVAPGTVADSYGGAVNAGGRYGQVLVEHRSGAAVWWSGYLHLSGIQVSPGDPVTTETVLGFISNTSPKWFPKHLHFAVYTGANERGGLRSFDTSFEDRGESSETAAQPDDARASKLARREFR